jgi:predicted DNA-binding transcriptional regulator AlpA
MKKRRKSTPVKTPAGIANVSPDGRVRVDASSKARESSSSGTLGARGPPDAPDDDILLDRLLFLPHVEQITGLSYSTIRRHELQGTFPRRHRHGIYSVWFRSEITAYMEALRANPCGPGPAPVKAIEARRQAAAQRRHAAA